MAKKGKGIKKTKKRQEKEKDLKTALIFSAEDLDDDSYESGMFIGKEEAQIIYNALKEYKPTEKEDHLHGILLEGFEEMLVCDYGEPYPDAN
jgi:hypothetical protein